MNLCTPGEDAVKNATTFSVRVNLIGSALFLMYLYLPAFLYFILVKENFPIQIFSFCEKTQDFLLSILLLNYHIQIIQQESKVDPPTLCVG